MKRSAFTLIEVMVVLSILAIIAILAYNFFGSTMKEAKQKQALTQLHRAFTTISDGITKMQMDDPTLTDNFTSISDLVTTGVLKSLPAIPEWFVDTGSCPAPFSWDQGFYGDNGGPSTADEFHIYFEDFCITDEACNAWNAAYAPSIGDARWDGSGFTFPSNEITYCVDWNASADQNTIFYIQTLN